MSIPYYVYRSTRRRNSISRVLIGHSWVKERSLPVKDPHKKRPTSIRYLGMRRGKGGGQIIRVKLKYVHPKPPKSPIPPSYTDYK